MSDVEPVNRYFGVPWGSPFLADAEQVPAPVGEKCMECAEPIADGDQGVIMPLGYLDASGAVAHRQAPSHRECLLVNIMGHLVGTCYCVEGLGTHRERGRETVVRLTRLRKAHLN